MSAWRKRWDGALGLAAAGTAVAAVAALLAPLGWPFELFAHFRWQVGVAAAILAVAALVSRRPWLMAIAVAVLLAQGLPTLLPGRTALAHGADAHCTTSPLRIVTVNAWFANTDTAPLVDWLARSDADVIAVQEFTPAWAAAFAPLLQAYPHHVLLARPDPYGIALLSRWPLEDAGAVDFAGDGLPSLVAYAQLSGGRTLRVIAMHTHWPMTRALQQLRDVSLQAAARLAATGGIDTVLVGDLNLTPYAPAYTRLVEQSGLRDALHDVAWRPTWQAGFWPLALPIDHVLVPRAACVVAQEIGPDVHSDHRPLQVTLQLR